MTACLHERFEWKGRNSACMENRIALKPDGYSGYFIA
jgi:hypothetical protein